MNRVTYIILCVLCIGVKVAVAGDTVSIHTDFIYVSGKKIAQDVFYTIPAETKMSAKLECYRYATGGDSVLMGRIEAPDRKFRKGTGRIQLLYNGTGYKGYLQPSFAQTLKQTGIIPPGNYKVFVSLNNDSIKISRTFLREIDSLLPPQSSLRTDMHSLLLSGSKGMSQRKGGQASSDRADRVFRRSRRQMERHFRRKGVNMVYRSQEGKEIADLYYGAWYLGRYEMDSKTPVSSQVAREQRQLSAGTGSLTGNELGNYQSLFSQFRELKKGRKDHNETEGMLSWSSVFSNDQEPGSAQDNIYHELSGSLEVPVMDLPVTFEGLYTTQDRGRETKAGYVRMHYDSRKSKEKLLKLIGDYNQRYAHTTARGSGYQMVYGQFIQQAKAQQAEAIDRLKREAALAEFDSAGFDPETLKARAEAQAQQEGGRLKDPASGEAQDVQAKAEARHRQLREQYDKIMGLEQQIRRYQTLLDQYRHTLHYDSLLAYDKIKDLEHPEDLSYKDLSKKADRILPEGKAKGFLTGITSMDLGMFPKYVSGYTLSGQRMTGLDFGYDIGIAEAGVSYGKTEYANRDGSVEGYRSYSGRVMFKPVLKQTIGLVYYGYTPGRKLINEGGFFKNMDVSLPSFRKPVHIYSALYRNELSRYATLSGEYALSRRQGETVQEGMQSKRINDQSAYNIAVSGYVPRTGISLEAGYEHTGSAFENSTLPVIMAGTDRYRAAGKGDFFRSFLTLGVEYNYMQQKGFHYRGGNSRWGFDIGTHSRRYPSVFLSYKPFSTFRAYDDTLSIAQKPLLGAVWTGRVTYQVKRPDHAFRFAVLYNRSSSINDTVTYGSDLIQLTTIYTGGPQNITLSVGSSRINTNLVTEAFPAFNNSRFVNLTAGRNMGRTDLTAGGDLAWSNIGLSRYGIMVAAGYRPGKMPVMMRVNFRYANYRLEKAIAWKQLYAGGLELIWQFRRKIKN